MFVDKEREQSLSFHNPLPSLARSGYVSLPFPPIMHEDESCENMDFLKGLGMVGGVWGVQLPL